MVVLPQKRIGGNGKGLFGIRLFILFINIAPFIEKLYLFAVNNSVIKKVNYIINFFIIAFCIGININLRNKLFSLI